jgi:peptidoglycan/xylan/chitin deacetylase (PgdA/CDA1 family)
MYHGVLPRTETTPAVLRGNIQADALERHLQWLSRYARVLSLGEAIDLIRSGERAPPRATVLTFDDGLGNQAQFALPLLERYRLPATFFVATDHLRPGRILWHNRLVLQAVDEAGIGRGSLEALRRLRDWVESDPNANPSERVAQRYGLDVASLPVWERLRIATQGMSTDQLLSMSRSPVVEIGAHTVTHPRLSTCSIEEIDRELTDGRRTLEAIIGRPVRFFAYPEGAWNDRVVQAVRRAGFQAAAAVEPADGPLEDLFRLPRLAITRGSKLRMVAKWAGLTGPIRTFRRAVGLRVPTAPG